MLHRVLVPIHSSNIGREIVPSWCRNSGPDTCLQDGHQGNTRCEAAEAATTQRELGDMCLSNTKHFPYPRRNSFSTDRPILPIVTPKKRSHTRSIWLHPKRFSTSQKSLQIKHRAKINIAARLNMNLRGRWPGWSVLPPDRGMKMTALLWRKRCWLSTHNKVKSEQCFAVTSAKRVAVFQASLKVVIEEVGAQLSKRDNKHLTSQGSNCLQEEGCCK